MFWNRKPKKLKPAWFYLDAAAGILQAREKCEGATHDDWGRVDVAGAMRLAVWGVTNLDNLPRSKRGIRYSLWEKYDQVKALMHEYLHAHHPDYNSDICNRNWQTTHLTKWSDTTTQDDVIEWMKRAAKEAARNAR